MNLFGLTGILTGIFNLVFGIFVYFKNRGEKVNQIFALMAIVVAIWGFGGYKISTITNPTEALLWWRLTYIGVICIAALFIHFVYTFLEIKKKWPVIVFYLATLFFFVMQWTPYFVSEKNMKWVFDSFFWIAYPTPLYVAFLVFWGGTVIYGHIKMYGHLKKESNIRRNQIRYTLIATGIGFAGGFICFVPVFNINLYPVSNLTIAFYSILLSYSITRHHLFNIRTIAIEIFAIVIALFSLIPTIFSGFAASLGMRIFLSASILFVSYLLIRGIQREDRDKEKLEQLTIQLKGTKDSLEEKVTEQTQELRQKVNELEKFYQLTVGRELKMVELKKKIKDVEKENGY